MRILLIDDDKAPMRYYVRELEKNGNDVHQARNADEALEKMANKEKPFEFIILDSALPPGKVFADKPTELGALTGQYLFEQIRQEYPALPILILTNFPNLEWIQKSQGLPKVRSARKIDLMPMDLIKLVKEINSERRSH